MCRLLAVLSRTPATVAQVLGEDLTEQYLELGSLHRDGWGTAWISEGGADLAVLRGQHAGATDPNLRQALFSESAVARIVHERLAKFPPRIIRPGNVHPFVTEGMAFAHNGTLGNHNVLKWRMPIAQRSRLRGGTDSEIYFRMICNAVQRGTAISVAVLEVARTLRDRLPTSSLNALILTSTELIVVHASEHTPIPNNLLRRRLFVGDKLPREHDEHYYLLRMRQTKDSLSVASTGVDETGWTDLPHESVTTIGLSDFSQHTKFLKD